MNYLTYLMDNNDIALLLLGICIIPIAILLIVAIVLRIVKAKKKGKQKKEKLPNDEQKQVFLEAYGGPDNVSEIEIERNKIKVYTKDIEKVDGNKLQELGATGVLLVGDEVRCSFGDRAEDIYKLLKKED